MPTASAKIGAPSTARMIFTGVWLWALCALSPIVSANSPVELVSVPGVGVPESLSAGGDSYALSMTPDGSYVLFASTANNLKTNTFAEGFIDLYLFCRTNGSLSLVSENAQAKGGGNDNSDYGVVTPDGRFVVFQSRANNLVTNDLNSFSDIFIRDIASGKTRLISVNQQGTAGGNGDSSSPVISADGRYVAFVSKATDLVAGDNNEISDIFLRDLQTDTTIIVSVGAQASSESSLSSSDTPAITPDGRYVAFTSSASQLVNGASTAGQEVYVRDVVGGQTFWASQNITASTLRASYSPVISEDGQYVAFKIMSRSNFQIVRCKLSTLALDIVSTNAAGVDSSATDNYGPVMSPDGRFVVYSQAGNGQVSQSVWLWDGQSKSSTQVSVTPDGQPALGISDTPTVTPDGRFVVFMSSATNLLSNPVSSGYQVYVRDMQKSATTLVSMNPDGTASGGVDGAIPCISSDGRLVLFDSQSDTLYPGDLNHASDVFVRNLSVPETELVSRSGSGISATDNYAKSQFVNNAVSADGRYLVFESTSDNLVPGDTNGFSDVIVRDLQLGSNILVSVNQTGTGSGNGMSFGGSITPNGQFVVFSSYANDLVANTTNQMVNVYLRDLIAGTTRLVSVTTAGGANTSGTVSALSVSDDGRYVLFWASAARNWVNTNTMYNGILLRDMVQGTLRLVGSNINPNPQAQLSSDGRFVIFNQTTPSKLILFDTQTGASQALSPSATAEAFSRDGQKLAYIDNSTGGSSNKLVLADLIHGTNTSVFLGANATVNKRAVSVSTDGRWVAFSSRVPVVGPDTNQFENVFICDVPNANLFLASVNVDGNAGGSGASVYPSLSADGRFVAFRSAASNLANNDNNNGDDIFVFDRLAGRGTLVSRNLDGLSSGNAMSVMAVMAPNGQKVAFTSAASDLVPNDWNNAIDIFAAGIDQTIPVTTDPAVRSLGADRQEGMTKIHWTTTPGLSYRVQYQDTLAPTGWQELPGVVIIVGASAWTIDMDSLNVPQRFYRVRVAQ